RRAVGGVVEEVGRVEMDEVLLFLRRKPGEGVLVHYRAVGAGIEVEQRVVGGHLVELKVVDPAPGAEHAVHRAALQGEVGIGPDHHAGAGAELLDDGDAGRILRGEDLALEVGEAADRHATVPARANGDGGRQLK